MTRAIRGGKKREQGGRRCVEWMGEEEMINDNSRWAMMTQATRGKFVVVRMGRTNS